MRSLRRLLALFLLTSGSSITLGGGCSDPAPAPAPTSSGRPATEAVRLALGRTFSCFLASDASVQCWGELPAEVGDRPVEQRVRAPHRVVGLEQVHELASSDSTLCARTRDRRVLCWGPEVHGDGEAEHPIELGALAGSRAIAIVGVRVCGLVGERLVCAGPNVPTLHERISEGSWLSAVDDAICVLDGVAPARCVETSGHALWAVEGSEGAVSISRARGLCVTTAEGALRCDAAASSLEEARLAPVAGIEDARLVAGTSVVRCISREGGTECERDEDAAGPRETALNGPIAALGVAASGTTSWHACALQGDEVLCWGSNQVGESGPRATTLVERVAGAPSARAIALARGRIALLDEEGHLRMRPFAQAETGPPLAAAGALLDLSRCWPDRGGDHHLCGRAEGDRLVVVSPTHEVREIAGFAARGPLFMVGWRVCAAGEAGGAVCAQEAGAVTTLADLAQPVSFESRLCGLRGGRILCTTAALLRLTEVSALELEPLADGPRRVARLFGGAEQLFAQLEGGTWIALGHNGVGQLGVAPSRPVTTPVPTAANELTSMAFAHHLSCGWAAEGAVVCAGLDERLRPREVEPVDYISGALPERGDGTWTAVPEVRDVRAVDSDGRLSCALGADGAITCWGEAAPPVEWTRVETPSVITIAQ